MSPPPPPPPPPPMCLPFKSRPRSKPEYSQRDSDSNSNASRTHLSEKSRPPSQHSRTPSKQLVRSNSYSPTATLTSYHPDTKLEFETDSEDYDVPPPRKTSAALVRATSQAKLSRSNTRTSQKPAALERSDTQNTKKSLPWRIGYGWGVRRSKEKGRAWDNDREMPPLSTETQIIPHPSVSRHSSKSSRTKNSRRSSNDSTATLVGSAYERKLGYVEPVRIKIDTTERLAGLRNLMQKDNLDYYVVPSEDPHQSEYVADGDKRRQWISGFTGSAGQAVVSKTSAYLITDSRYWLQAQEQLDSNWHLIPAGDVGGPKDWIEWIVDRAIDSRIGVDARMISHDVAILLNSKLTSRSSKLIFPPQNLVDLLWKDRPLRTKNPLLVQGREFSGKDATEKIREVREWIKAQPPSVPSYSKSPATPAQMQVATLITSLANIAWLLNLRGNDIPFNPLFHSYLFVGLSQVVLFVDAVKVPDNVASYLKSIGVERREYNDVWAYLRRREWGEGKVLITPQTSYAISLMLTHFRYTIAPSFVEELKSVKNEVELDGMRRAYVRDGVAFVKFLAWLDHKLSQGYEITEWEAAFQLDEFRKEGKHFMGLAYETISAAGPNAALPHYSPTKGTAAIIDRETPYVCDSGGQYRDGTCDTTRTVHFGRPTAEQCEAYTRVLQGHMAVDSAVFPEGTSGQQLDVLARRALWRDGLNYIHGTGHGIGSYLNVHEGPHGFASRVPLLPGHVITNEPGFYKAGEWGMRIESALAVRRVQTKGEFNGDIWLGFERLTCVPIQTRMVKEGMLCKEEKQWLRDHNKRCREKLEPYLKGDSKNDKRALKWLIRESERGIGLVGTGPGGFSIDWD